MYWKVIFIRGYAIRLDIISTEKTYLSVSYDYDLIESHIYFRGTILVKNRVYRFIKLLLLYSYV